ncbi:MAG: MmcQ/YjbR family DNA-binding protein [Cytophagales bacterium]|nr:MmcQ/YjbR family DNA-binding protein [Cytophagales bacterium]
MITIEAFKKLAMALPEVTKAPHFEKISFRVRNKIFSTLDVSNKRVCIKLSEVDQSVFCLADKSIMYAVPNKWGKQGWTFIELRKIKKSLCIDALTTAYCTVAPKSLAFKSSHKQGLKHFSNIHPKRSRSLR